MTKSSLRAWARDLVISVLASVFIITVLWQPVRVEGTSMQPGLMNHDRLFINKFFFRFEKIHRGEIVVFHYPLDPRKSYIKRVIGLPGQTIKIVRGQVYIDGQPIKEPYVPARYRDTRSMAPLVIPPHMYFVLGDHRSISSDSRDFGPVPRKLIYGEAEFVYWPVDAMGTVR